MVRQQSNLERILRVLAEEFEARRKLKLEKAFIDASFTGQKRGLAVGPTKRGKGTKIIALADDHSLPVAVSIESASPRETSSSKASSDTASSTPSRRD